MNFRFCEDKAGLCRASHEYYLIICTCMQTYMNMDTYLARAIQSVQLTEHACTLVCSPLVICTYNYVCNRSYLFIKCYVIKTPRSIAYNIKQY